MGFEGHFSDPIFVFLREFLRRKFDAVVLDSESLVDQSLVSEECRKRGIQIVELSKFESVEDTESEDKTATVMFGHAGSVATSRSLLVNANLFLKMKKRAHLEKSLNEK